MPILLVSTTCGYDLAAFGLLLYIILYKIHID